MGYDTKKDLGILVAAILEVLRLIKADAEEASPAEVNQLWKTGAFICIATSCALRGHEGFYVDLAGLRANLHLGRDGVVPPKLTKSTILSEAMCLKLPHVAVCMLGKFKGEDGINYHTVNVANVSQSGFQTRWWVEKLVKVGAR